MHLPMILSPQSRKEKYPPPIKVPLCPFILFSFIFMVRTFNMRPIFLPNLKHTVLYFNYKHSDQFLPLLSSFSPNIIVHVRGWDAEAILNVIFPILHAADESP